MFVTVFYAILNIQTGEVLYCNAGHNPPYMLKRSGEVVALPMSQDPMVGAIEGIEYHSQQLQLDKGDALVLFTDGVTEAMNSQNEEFGEDRLEDTLKDVVMSDCQKMVDVIKDDVSDFAGEAEQSDDITILALRRK
jgi:sigma-B regulation protein RsbU (phosphoserine phosphatase)